MAITSRDIGQWDYKDTGCGGACTESLACPYPVCFHDVPGGLNVLLAALRKREELLASVPVEMKREAKRRRCPSIIEEEAVKAGLAASDLTGPSRIKRHVAARTKAAQRMRDEGMLLKVIAGALNRHHTTIIHSLSKCGGKR